MGIAALAGRSILIVEDEPLIVFDLTSKFEAGWRERGYSS
jgi:hypothetical protein